MDMVRSFTAYVTVALLYALGSVAGAAEAPVYCGTSQWRSFIDGAATRFTFPARWIDATIRAESAGCESIDGHPTMSAAGAMGLMQLMPATWSRFRQTLALGSNAYDPHDNILAGTAYLRELVDRYGWPGASAAYHAGPALYDEHLATGQALPAATLDYLARIDRALARTTGDANASDSPPARLPPTNRSLFIDRNAADRATEAPSGRTSASGLFVVLRRVGRNARSKIPDSNDVQPESH